MARYDHVLRNVVSSSMRDERWNQNPCEVCSSATLCALPVFSEAIGIDRDVGLAVKVFGFTIRADFALYVGNYNQTALHLCPERFPHPSDAAATTVRTALECKCFHIDRFAETRI